MLARFGIFALAGFAWLACRSPLLRGGGALGGYAFVALVCRAHRGFFAQLALHAFCALWWLVLVGFGKRTCGKNCAQNSDSSDKMSHKRFLVF